MIKYPVGQSSFREIRKGGFLYVDKTMYIHELASTGKYFFLSRPRRFGKSMLISTMDSYFRGERELFDGLAIDRLEPGEWTRHPVLRLDFMRGGYRAAGELQGVLSDVLSEWEEQYGELSSDEAPARRFTNVIREAYRRTGRQVVILIDEYDKPIIDVADNKELEAEHRRILHDFYGVMKASEDCLKFVFLTGVGKLGQINVFSGLNNLKDISLHPDYSAICGITTQELLDNFKEGIDKLAEDMEVSPEEALAELKNHYDGYHFSQKLIDVYNPFSLANALFDRSIRDYWFNSGTPTRLVNEFLRNDWGKPDLEGTVVSVSDLDSGDVLGDNLALTCYYTGYLTIKDYDQEYEEFTLGYPNVEVRRGFFNSLLRSLKKQDAMGTNNFVHSLRRFIRHDDIDGFLHEMQSFLAGVPYLPYTDKETQWQKDILIIGRLVGLNVDVERRTSRGRFDMVLDGTTAIYILEFKYGSTPEKALEQINEKEYDLPYENSLNTKRIVKVGVNISPDTRNIDGWIIQ